VYITGSVASAWGHVADIDAFRAAFCDKGPMSFRMTRVPVHHIVAQHPALKGLAVAPLF
jgi:glucokinase